MSLLPRQADPSPGALGDEVPVASLESEDGRRRRWWHLGPYIERVRGDSLLRNSLFIMATPLMTAAVGYIFWLVAAHLYNASAVGLTAAVISASAIVVMLSWVGVGGTLIKSLPGQSKSTGWSTTFWAGMTTVVFLAIVLCGIALVVVPFFSPKLIVLHSIEYAAVFAVGTVALAAGNTLDWVFIAERRASDQFGRNSGAAAVRVLAVGLLGLAAGPDALRLLGAWGAASAFGLGLGVALLVRHRRVSRPPRFAVLARTALGFRSRAAGFQVIGMAGGLLSPLLALLVTARLSTSDTAYFFTAWMFGELLFAVSPAVSVALFAEGAHRPDELDAMTRSAFRITFAVLVPASVVTLAVGGAMLSTLGPAYAAHGAGLLRIIVLASIPGAVISVLGGALLARGRFTIVAMVYLGISIGTLAISWLLLPVIGISAVGWAFLAMQLCGCVYVVLDRRIQTSPKRQLSARQCGEAF